MKITVVGLGYVGLSNALLFAAEHNVIGVDSDPKRIAKLKSGVSPIKDTEIEEYLPQSGVLWTTDISDAAGSDLFIIAVPTYYDETQNFFDTSIVESVIGSILALQDNPVILIKSTIPVGYVEKQRAAFKYDKIYYSAEFLREGSALYDNLYPSRIVVGDKGETGIMIGDLYRQAAINDPPVLLTEPTEAEAIKLFANTYLALRVAYFNEIDTFCELKNLNAEDIITGVGLDPRVGMFYNNPSFGYGGFCLPKDTKQLRANYGDDVPQVMISAIVTANDVRKKHIAKRILDSGAETVGIYRLVMKSGSDNFRSAAILDIMDELTAAGRRVLIYEPLLKDSEFRGAAVVNDFEAFASRCDIILANRADDKIKTLGDKVYTRGIFGEKS